MEGLGFRITAEELQRVPKVPDSTNGVNRPLCSGNTLVQPELRTDEGHYAQLDTLTRPTLPEPYADAALWANTSPTSQLRQPSARAHTPTSGPGFTWEHHIHANFNVYSCPLFYPEVAVPSTAMSTLRCVMDMWTPGDSLSSSIQVLAQGQPHSDMLVPVVASTVCRKHIGRWQSDMGERGNRGREEGGGEYAHSSGQDNGASRSSVKPAMKVPTTLNGDLHYIAMTTREPAHIRQRRTKGTTKRTTPSFTEHLKGSLALPNTLPPCEGRCTVGPSGV